MFVWGNDWGDAMEAEDGDQGFMDFVADVDMGAGALQWEVSGLPRDLAAAAPEVPKESTIGVTCPKYSYTLESGELVCTLFGRLTSSV